MSKETEKEKKCIHCGTARAVWSEVECMPCHEARDRLDDWLAGARETVSPEVQKKLLLRALNVVDDSRR